MSSLLIGCGKKWSAQIRVPKATAAKVNPSEKTSFNVINVSCRRPIGSVGGLSRWGLRRGRKERMRAIRMP